MQEFLHDAAKTLAPGGLSCGVADQVLANFDDGIGEPALGPVLPQAVALELARVRLVLADDQVTFGKEALQQRLGEPRALVPKDFPRARAA